MFLSSFSFHGELIEPELPLMSWTIFKEELS